MATWTETREHLQKKFTLAKDEPDWIGIGWKFMVDGREVPQRQRIEPVTVFGRPCVLIWSDVVDANRVPPRLALERNMVFSIGALAVSADLYVLRAVLPLDGLDWELFDKTLEYVAGEAARLREGVPPLPVTS